jgi:hypothetical protein
MKKFKNYLPAATALVILVLVLSTLSSESKSSANDLVTGVSTFAGMDGIRYLVSVTHIKAQAANDQALKGAEEQRRLVAEQQQMLRTPRERAREKAVLQQLEANARRNAEILESVKLLATELKKVDCKGEASKSRER